MIVSRKPHLRALSVLSPPDLKIIEVPGDRSLYIIMPLADLAMIYSHNYFQRAPSLLSYALILQNFLSSFSLKK